jgi:pectin lyase
MAKLVSSDYFDNVSGHAIDAEVGAVALAEGNYFVRFTDPSFSGAKSYLNPGLLPQNKVTTPSLTGGNSNGQEYFIQTSADASTCQSSLGRACQVNTLLSSGSVASRVSSSVLSALKSQSYVTGYKPLTAQAAVRAEINLAT